MVHVEDIRGQQRLNDKRPVLHTFNQGIVKQAFMRRMLIDKIECVPGLKNEIGIQSLSDDADFFGDFNFSLLFFTRLIRRYGKRRNGFFLFRCRFSLRFRALKFFDKFLVF